MLTVYQTTKLTEFADDKLNVNEMILAAFDAVGIIKGKGENASHQHFLLFQ